MEVVPSPREYGYRTRMDYVYGWGKLGLRKKGDGRSVLMLDECHLIPERAFEAVLKVRAEIQRLDVRSYQYTNHRGYLRYVSLRAAPERDELLLNFLTNGTDPAIRPVLEAAREWADAVVWSTTERTADVSVGDTLESFPRDWIEEQVGPHLLRFGAHSFFQSNPWVTAAMYEDVAQRVQGRVLDMCCGVGGFSIWLGARGIEVVGVDSNEEGLAYARHNAEVNEARTATFVAADLRKFDAWAGYDSLILDPPRAGLGPKVVRRIARNAPPRIVYISCNPKVLAGELAHFAGYEPSDWRAYDLFPQTPHCEVVVTLTRR